MWRYVFVWKAIICLLAGLVSLTARAADWDIWKKTPARIEVLACTPKPLEKSAVDDKNAWIKVPDNLLKYGAQIYLPDKGLNNGVVDITVVDEGYLFIACNYDYQGNSSGNWKEEVWDEKRFKAKGWHVLSKSELGGILAKGDNKEQAVLMKRVKAGEKFRFRCNKYDPPYPILLSQ